MEEYIAEGIIVDNKQNNTETENNDINKYFEKYFYKNYGDTE